MKNQTKQDDQPLLYWELHDESNKNWTFRSSKSLMLVFILLAIGFGAGYMMQNSTTPSLEGTAVALPILMPLPETAVGDNEDENGVESPAILPEGDEDEMLDSPHPAILPEGDEDEMLDLAQEQAVGIWPPADPVLYNTQEMIVHITFPASKALGFNQNGWEAAGKITTLQFSQHPKSCKAQCNDALNKLQPSCYWDLYTGVCQVASHGRHTGTYDTVNYVNNHGGRSYRQGFRKDLIANIPEDYQADKVGNSGTHRCAWEGGFCPCQGAVSYVRADNCKFFGAVCSYWDWTKIIDNHPNMATQQVRAGIMCDHSAGGVGMNRDPDSGVAKQCFCHPARTEHTPHPHVPATSKMWSEARCKARFVGGGEFFSGFMTGFTCTGLCPAQAATCLKPPGCSVALGTCTESCFCLFKGWV